MSLINYVEMARVTGVDRDVWVGLAWLGLFVCFVCLFE
jgi:hypothetical protein